MLIIIFRGAKTLVALGTLKGFLHSMSGCMPLEMWWVSKTLITLVTFIRLHTCVSAFMSPKSWSLSKIFTTITTLMGPLATLCGSLSLQVWWKCSRLFTLGTLKRSVTIVTLFILITTTLTLKWLITTGTLSSTVCFFASQEMWGMFESPSTLSALAGFGTSMCLLVTPKLWRKSNTFLTLTTNICWSELADVFSDLKQVESTSHTANKKRVFHLCESVCVSWDQTSLKAFPHSLQLYNFSPAFPELCTWACIDPASGCGVTLMCVLWCRWRLEESAKHLSHQVHLKGFSPVWILLCLFSSGAMTKHFSHCIHLNSLIPKWAFWCLRWICETVTTLGTFISLLASMPPLMSLAIWWRRETLVTKQTTVWFFSSMWPFVHCKVGWNPKANPTLWALIRFFTSMCSFVDSEVWSSWEILVAFYTFEDLFLHAWQHRTTLVNLNRFDVSSSWSDLFQCISYSN